MLTARHALCRVVRVSADEHPPVHPTSSSVYAVFSTSDGSVSAEHFLGLVTSGQTADYHERIFADLLTRSSPEPVTAQTPLSEVAAILDQEHAEAIAVLDDAGELLGGITRASLLDALLRDKPAAQGVSSDILYDIAQILSTNTGDSLLNKLVLSLTKALGIDYAFVGQVSPGNAEIIQTIAFCDHGHIVDNIEYPLMANTACGSVGCRTACYFPEDSRKLYPEDGVMSRFQVEAFIGQPLLNASGEVLGLLAIMHSAPLSNAEQIQSILQISAARVVAELEHQRDEARLTTLSSAIEQTADSVIITDPDGEIVYVNPAFEQTTGYSRAEAMGQQPSLVKSGQHDTDFYRGLWETIQSGKPFCDIFINRRKDGTLYYEEKTITPLTDENGRITQFVSTGKDITERRQAENALQANNEILERIFDTTHFCVVYLDIDFNFIQVNKAYARVCGFPADYFPGKNHFQLYPHAENEAIFRKVVRTGQAASFFAKAFEFPDHPEWGVTYWDWTLHPVKNAEGRVEALLFILLDVSERKQAEMETRGLQHFLNSVVENLPNMLFVKDAEDLRFVRFNKVAEELLGYQREELLGKNDYDVFPKTEADFFTTMDREVLKSGELLDIPCETIRTRHQGERLLHTRKIPIFDEAGQPKYLLGISEDITERKITEDRAAQLGRILERSSNEIYVFDATTLLFTQVNQGALNNLGYSLDELRCLTPVDLEPSYTLESFRQLIEALRHGEEETLSFVTEHKRKDGSLYPAEVHLQYSSIENPPVFVAVVSDITERKQAQERLNYLAFYDTLTGLPNRLLLIDRLRQAMLESSRHERLVAIMYLDLDRFKLVNDTLGHEAGDILLKEVADRLSACVRAGDTIARLGGDEFTVVLANVAHEDDVGRIAHKLLEVFAQPFILSTQEVFVSPSIGITLYPHDDTDPEMLLKNADAAMYHAKDTGRNTFQFFTPELNSRATRRLDLETALRHALERDEFVLHYQPQVDLNSGQMTGVEALIRWQRPETGLVSPLDFIPLAEDTGLIVPIGEWVLRTACAQNLAWQRAGLATLHMSVNIAARQFQQQDLTEVITRVLHETRLDPCWLTLEITESTVMRDTHETIKTLQHIGALGVTLSMDDFGTGYSSLSYLKRFPLNYLKIDKSFIDDVTTDRNDAAIATAIIRMAGSLELGVIAEGVETRAQLNFLKAQGCSAMQGYYFSKPLPASELTSLLTEDRHFQG